LDHASGATERTLLVAVVDKLILKMKRSEQRYQMHVERLGLTASEFSREEVDMQAIEVADIDNDGIKDIVTGKCFYAHNGRDPGAEDPAVLYWFKTQRKSNDK